MSQQDYRKRTIVIAKGEYRPAENEPKLWFESLQSMAQVLGGENQKLLALILEKKPQSLKELAELSGRKSSNLSRTLKTLEQYGIVELEKDNKTVIPRVKATRFQVEFGLQI
jgi:predicted transcriptional regulator